MTHNPRPLLVALSACVLSSVLLGAAALPAQASGLNVNLAGLSVSVALPTPQNVQTTATSDGRLQVSWSAPTLSVLQTLTGYSVKILNSSNQVVETDNADGTVNTITSGVLPNGTYTAQVSTIAAGLISLPMNSSGVNINVALPVVVPTTTPTTVPTTTPTVAPVVLPTVSVTVPPAVVPTTSTSPVSTSSTGSSTSVSITVPTIPIVPITVPTITVTVPTTTDSGSGASVAVGSNDASTGSTDSTSTLPQRLNTNTDTSNVVTATDTPVTSTTATPAPANSSTPGSTTPSSTAAAKTAPTKAQPIITVKSKRHSVLVKWGTSKVAKKHRIALQAKTKHGWGKVRYIIETKRTWKRLTGLKSNTQYRITVAPWRTKDKHGKGHYGTPSDYKYFTTKR